MSIRVTQIAVEGLDNNLSYVIHDEVSKDCCIVDPSGVFFRLQKAVEVLGLRVVGILLTHTHDDHIDALETAVADYPVPVFVHQNGSNALSVTELKIVVDGDTIPLGTGEIQVIYTPGHNNDSVCYFIKKQSEASPQLVSGDTLFIDGCGRPFGDVEQLYESLQKLKKLPPDTIIYPGHDYGSSATDTLANQLRVNKYLNTDSKEEFIKRRMG